MTPDELTFLHDLVADLREAAAILARELGKAPIVRQLRGTANSVERLLTTRLPPGLRFDGKAYRCPAGCQSLRPFRCRHLAPGVTRDS